MNTTAIITALSLTIVSSASIGIAHKQGWGSFGEFGSGITETDSCKAQVQAVGWSSGSGSRSVAETKALVNWSKQTMQSHGQGFSSWHNARSRNVSCKNTSGKTTKCTVAAHPCQVTAEADLDNLF